MVNQGCVSRFQQCPTFFSKKQSERIVLVDRPGVDLLGQPPAVARLDGPSLQGLFDGFQTLDAGFAVGFVLAAVYRMDGGVIFGFVLFEDIVPFFIQLLEQPLGQAGRLFQGLLQKFHPLFVTHLLVFVCSVQAFLLKVLRFLGRPSASGLLHWAASIKVGALTRFHCLPIVHQIVVPQDFVLFGSSQRLHCLGIRHLKCLFSCQIGLERSIS